MNLFDRHAGTRRIAVVPAHDEATAITTVLDKLSHRVDDLVVVDDGSTDGTRAEIEAWLPGHDHCRLLSLDEHRGPSAAYHLAFTDLRRRLAAGELDSDDLVLTVDAGGQHDLDVLDDLHRQAVDGQLDALLVRRDLSAYPPPEQVGNRLLSAWATLWAGGVRLHDATSGYRILRLGPLVDALDYYRGDRCSEAVELAVVLSRLGYAVRNDIVVPAPLPRSRPGMVDAAVDLVAIPRAAVRVTLRRQKHRPVPSLVPPTAVTLGLAAVPVQLARAVVRSRRRRQVR